MSNVKIESVQDIDLLVRDFLRSDEEVEALGKLAKVGLLLCQSLSSSNYWEIPGILEACKEAGYNV